MNVSLTAPIEAFVRQKVTTGDYETASEVVRDALRLLKHRDEVWKAQLQDKIAQGVHSIRAGNALSESQLKAEMAAFKTRQRKAALK